MEKAAAEQRREYRWERWGHGECEVEPFGGLGYEGG